MVDTIQVPIVLPGTIMGTLGGAFPSIMVLDMATAMGHGATMQGEVMVNAITMAHDILAAAISITDGIEVIEGLEVMEDIEDIEGN